MSSDRDLEPKQRAHSPQAKKITLRPVCHGRQFESPVTNEESRAGDMGVGVVVMDGLEILGAYRKPRDIIVLFKLLGYVAHYIFYKLGI
jgi:hypothetical protein